MVLFVVGKRYPLFHRGVKCSDTSYAMLAVERCCSRPDHHLKAPRHSDKGLLTGQSELLGPVLVIQNLWLVSGLFYSGLLPVLLHPGPTDIRLPGLHLWLRFLTWRWQFVGEHVRQDHSRLKRSHSRGPRVQRSG